MLVAAGFVIMLAGYARPVGGGSTLAMLGGGGLFWAGALMLAYAFFV